MNDKKETRNNNPSKGKKSLLRRILKWVAGTVVVLAILLVILLQFGLGPIIKNVAPKIGPDVLGTPVEISNVTVKAFSGLVDISGLVVGAPEGFKANVFEMDNFKVALSLPSIFSDTIVIREIVIKEPLVTYEMSALRTNIGAIMEKLDSGETEEKVEDPEDVKGGKKVIIEKFVFEGAKIRIATTATGGKGTVIPLPTINLEDIGKKSGGATVSETLYELIKSIGNGIIGVVGDIGGIVVDAAGAVGGAAVDAAGKTIGAVGDTAATIGGAAVDAADKAVGAVGSAAGKVGGAITGLFGKGDDGDKDPSPEPDK